MLDGGMLWLPGSAPEDTSKNEYLHKVEKYVFEGHWADKFDADSYVEANQQRRKFVDYYAWAVPNEKALATLAQYGPILEIGAGNGYWAYLLQQRGVDVKAYDVAPPASYPNHYHSGETQWTQVRRGFATVARRHPDRTLFLCWPPYKSPMAHTALLNYKGSVVVYIGEGDGGCTADDTFHEELKNGWTCKEEITLPRWPGIHDEMTVWTRKKRRSGKKT